MKRSFGCVAAIDMGGTNIKYGVVGENLRILTSGASAANSSDDRETLLSRLADIVNRQIEFIKGENARLCGIAVSTPGPFDYAAGKSGMKGKYDSISGVDLRAQLRERTDISADTEILFMQDAAAFLLGESVAGNAVGEKNCSCVTLGTGVGYACMIDGKMLLNERGGPYYVFAFQKHGDALIEELVSGRAIQKRFNTDGKTLSDRAIKGDKFAADAFYDIGKTIGEGLCSIAETEKIDKLIIGGQVAFSFELMKDGLIEGLAAQGRKISVERAKYPADAALIGAAYRLLEEGNDPK